MTNLNEESVFAEALEILNPQERARYLDRACAGDAGLRQNVESLISAYAAGQFLEAPAAAAVTTVDEPVSEGPGTVIGPYKLMEQIGEGGMGLVFVAEQRQPVRRRVALKVIKPGMDSRQVIARFEAERQALALMDHPNIAKVLDGGATASGRPYFVMELVRGVPVTQFCDENRLTTRVRLELFVSVCQAVQHAHHKGIIHRDLKPSNVLVASHDGMPVVKVIDFGLAKAIGQQLTEKTVYTQLTQMVGTPLYMSPEQAGQSSLDIDTRTDIYALGVLLYELLTGTTPFDQERLGTAGYDEIRRIIREAEPAKPSTRISTLGLAANTVSANRGSDPKRLRQLVRGELDWIVMKALEKDRNRRYETAKDFAADVQRYLADEPVLACPPSAGYRLRKFARRNKGRLAVATGLILAATVMAVSIGWAARDRAAQQAESKQAETARREKVEGQVHISLNTARTLIDENKLASAREKLAQARAQLGSHGSALSNLAAEVAASEAELDRFQQFLDLIDRAHLAETAPLLEPPLAVDGSPGGARKLAPARTGDRRPAAAVPFLLEALQCYGILERDDWDRTVAGGILGRPQVEQIRRLAYEELLWLADDVVRRQQEHRSEGRLATEAAARQALAYLGKAESAHRPTPALSALRARCHQALGEETAAQADTQRADQTPATMALDHALRGQAAYDAKQLAEGVQAFEAALRLEPTHYWSLMKLGYCLCDLGRGPEDFARAATAFTGCILKRPDHAHAYYCRAMAESKLGRYEEAAADSSKAIKLDPLHARAWYERGAAYLQLSQPDKAIADFTKAVELDPKFALAWNKRGWAYISLHRPDKALADLSKTIELDPQHAVAWNNRGVGYFQLGQPDKALADFSKAIELDPEFALAWNNRGRAYDRLRRPDEALADYSKAIELAPKTGTYWHTLGVAHYRAGDWKAAVAALDKSRELRKGGDAGDWFFLAMAYQKQGNPDEAGKAYEQAVQWLEKNKEALEKDKGRAEELRRFRVEAEEALELKKE